MATAPSSFASTKETTNYARLCRLLVDVGSQVLRYTFDKIHPPETLHTVLGSTSVHYATLQSLYKGRKKVLNPTQWGKLYPTHSPVSSATFDITLLTVLLRNICYLSTPVNGWDRLPPVTDISIAGDIARVKYYRNTIYSHASQASVDDSSFSAYWQEIREALVRLGGAHFRTEIDNLENHCMDPDIEEHYREMKKQDDDSIKGKLKEIEDSLENMRSIMERNFRYTNDKIDIEIKEVKEKLCSLTASAEKSAQEDTTKGSLEQMTGEMAKMDSEVKEVKENLCTLTAPMEENKGEGEGATILSAPGEIVDTLLAPSNDCKYFVRQLKDKFNLNDAALRNLDPDNKVLIRAIARKANNAGRSDVVEELRKIVPAGTTAPMLPESLHVREIPFSQLKTLTITLSGGDEWKIFAEQLRLTPEEIRFLDHRTLNPADAALGYIAQKYQITVGDLYHLLTECGLPVLADLL